MYERIALFFRTTQTYLTSFMIEILLHYHKFDTNDVFKYLSRQTLGRLCPRLGSPRASCSLSSQPFNPPTLRFPVVAMGVLKWVDWTVSEPRYFQLQTDHTPIHLALLDEVSR